MSGVGLAEVGQLAVVGGEGPHLLQLELPGDVRQPVLAERLPGEHIDRAGAEQ
ncbi:MAG: hypothetical protein MUE63_14565 [Xanthomonadales bacterium]|nr:hypothetical protein [Xanthomonadales bacterium]